MCNVLLLFLWVLRFDQVVVVPVLERVAWMCWPRFLLDHRPARAVFFYQREKQLIVFRGERRTLGVRVEIIIIPEL